jgi:hypothetical protein
MKLMSKSIFAVATVALMACDASVSSSGGGGGTAAGGGEGNGGRQVDAEGGGGIIRDAGPTGGTTGGAGGSGGVIGGAGGSGGVIGGAGGSGGLIGGAGGSGGAQAGGSGGSAGGSGGAQAGGSGGTGGFGSGGELIVGGGGGTGGFGVGGAGGSVIGGAGGEPGVPDAGVGGALEPDAFIPPPACVGADAFTATPDDVCCDGLTAACPNDFFGIACGDPCDGPQVCIRCGDGVCGPQEDDCNCPLDCMGGPIECTPAGGALMFGAPGAMCCAGLLPVPNIQPTPENICQLGGPGAGTICVAANNGDCGVGENFCNAPADCPPPEVPCSPNGAAVDAVAGSCCDAAAFIMPDNQPAGDNICTFGQGLICLVCGDQQCGDGESFCNCPGDCPPPAPPCVVDGMSLDPSNPQSVCCDGLAPIGCETPNALGVCLDECVGVAYCAACGDGACTGAENACNCPADCGAVDGCTAGGGSYPINGQPNFCCPGYGAIGCDAPNANGVCPRPGQGCLGSVFCAQCGDGVCSAEEHENPCNCPADCP